MDNLELIKIIQKVKEQTKIYDDFTYIQILYEKDELVHNYYQSVDNSISKKYDQLKCELKIKFDNDLLSLENEKEEKLKVNKTNREILLNIFEEYEKSLNILHILNWQIPNIFEILKIWNHLNLKYI
jgi:hypothetical protein